MRDRSRMKYRSTKTIYLSILPPPRPGAVLKKQERCDPKKGKQRRDRKRESDNVHTPNQYGGEIRKEGARYIIIIITMRSTISLRSLLDVIVVVGLTAAVAAATTTTTQATANEHGNGDGEYLVGTGIYDMYVPRDCYCYTRICLVI